MQSISGYQAFIYLCIAYMIARAYVNMRETEREGGREVERERERLKRKRDRASVTEYVRVSNIISCKL